MLPALPTMWYGSSISGICARGDIEVGIESDSNGMLKKAVLKVGADNDELKVKAEGLAQYTVKTADGTVVETTKLDDNTIVFAVKAGETYVLELSEA